MTIRLMSKEVPTGFAPAKLYLDDIEEIVRILVDAERNRQEKPYDDPNDKVKTTFEVENQVCDELADLAKIHPAFAHSFLVSLRRTGFHANLNMSKNDTTWYSYGLSENEEWGTFHRLEGIFERRELAWKSLLHSHRGLSYFIQGVATAVLPFLLVLPLVGRISRIAVTETVAGFLALGTLVIALHFGLRTHSTVIFRTRSEHHSELSQTAWRVVPGVAKFIGAFLAGMLSQYLAHRFWP